MDTAGSVPWAVYAKTMPRDIEAENTLPYKDGVGSDNPTWGGGGVWGKCGFVACVWVRKSHANRFRVGKKALSLE